MLTVDLCTFGLQCEDVVQGRSCRCQRLRCGGSASNPERFSSVSRSCQNWRLPSKSVVRTAPIHSHPFFLFTYTFLCDLFTVEGERRKHIMLMARVNLELSSVHGFLSPVRPAGQDLHHKHTQSLSCKMPIINISNKQLILCMYYTICAAKEPQFTCWS